MKSDHRSRVDLAIPLGRVLEFCTVGRLRGVALLARTCRPFLPSQRGMLYRLVIEKLSIACLGRWLRSGESTCLLHASGWAGTWTVNRPRRIWTGHTRSAQLRVVHASTGHFLLLPPSESKLKGWMGCGLSYPIGLTVDSLRNTVPLPAGGFG